MKKIVSLVLTFILLAGLTTGGFSATTADSSANKEYLKKINAYGIISNVPKESDLNNDFPQNGVFYAQLIDFDNTAPKELLIVRKEFNYTESGEAHTYFLEIWTYSKNKLLRIAQDQYDFEGGINYSPSGSEVISVTSLNAKNYLLKTSGWDRAGTEGETNYKLLELKTGKLATKETYKSYYADENYDGKVDVEKFSYKQGSGKETPLKKAAYNKKLNAVLAKEKKIINLSENMGAVINQPPTVLKETIKTLGKK